MGKLQERRPVRAGGVSALVLAEGVNQPCSLDGASLADFSRAELLLIAHARLGCLRGIPTQQAEKCPAPGGVPSGFATRMKALVLVGWFRSGRPSWTRPTNFRNQILRRGGAQVEGSGPST